MLQNFWQVSEFSSAITNQPKRITLLNQDIVLYRDSRGEVVALKNRCPHRGAALSGGWIEGDCIRCPYHGWKYQPDGACAEIPANQPGVPIPKRARVDSYPVQEKYGFVWLFVGNLPEEERPPIPPFSEFDEPAWRAVYGDFSWNAHYTRAMENGLDISHVPFLHGTTFGIKDQQQIEEYAVSLLEWGARATVTSKPPKPRGIWKYIIPERRPRLSTAVTFYMPNLLRIDFELGFRGYKVIFFGAYLPIDSNTTVTKWLALRNFLTAPWADGDTRKRTLNAMMQDRVVVETQTPKVVPEDLSAEIHVPSDALQLAYRKLRNKCLSMGWGIEGDRSPVLPSIDCQFADLTATPLK